MLSRVIVGLPRIAGVCLFAAVAGLSACAHASRASEDVRLGIMSWNIAAGGGDIERIAASIRSSGVDVVALQEVDVNWSARSNFIDQATLLAERTGMHVRFAPMYHITSASGASGASNASSASAASASSDTAQSTSPPRQYGVALLSRFPIVAFRNHSLTRLSTQQSNAQPAPMPGLLDAVIEVQNIHIRVFNTHLDYRADPALRATQVAEMLRIMDASESGDPHGATILAGDLNAPPDAAELRPLFERLTDSWRSAHGNGFTYPASAPVRRIDYVLHSKHFRVTETSVINTLASDHLPVRVDVVITATGIGR